MARRGRRGRGRGLPERRCAQRDRAARSGAVRRGCHPGRYLRRSEPARRLPALGRSQAGARRQAQGADQVAQDRPGAQEAEGHHLHRVRRHRPLSGAGAKPGRTYGVQRIDGGSSKNSAATSSAASRPTTTDPVPPNWPRKARRKSAC